MFDGLRPQTQALWQSLSDAQRSRFLRHALPWWSIHRHRVAPDVHERFSELVAEGIVKIHAGYVRDIEADADGRAVVTYRQRGRDTVAAFDADWIVNCTGMERAGIGHSPLLQAMRDRGMIAMDPLRLGITVDNGSRVVGPDGTVQRGLYAAGALTAGQFWEITAVPDIRVQAEAVARQAAEEIIRRLPQQARSA